MALIASALLWWQSVNKPVDSSSTENIKIVIPKGYSVTAIGSLLKEKDLIKSVWGFRILVKKENIENQLQAGSYSLQKSQNLGEIARL